MLKEQSAQYTCGILILIFPLWSSLHAQAVPRTSRESPWFQCEAGWHPLTWPLSSQLSDDHSAPENGNAFIHLPFYRICFNLDNKSWRMERSNSAGQNIYPVQKILVIGKEGSSCYKHWEQAVNSQGVLILCPSPLHLLKGFILRKFKGNQLQWIGGDPCKSFMSAKKKESQR